MTIFAHFFLNYDVLRYFRIGNKGDRGRKQKRGRQRERTNRKKNMTSLKEAISALGVLQSYFNHNDMDMHHVYEIGGQLSFNQSKKCTENFF